MRKGKFLDGIIYMNIALLIIFSIAILVVFYATGGMEPSALVYSFFAAFGVENGLCAWIYTSKLKLKSNNPESKEMAGEDNPSESQEDGLEEYIPDDGEGGKE